MAVTVTKTKPADGEQQHIRVFVAHAKSDTQGFIDACITKFILAFSREDRELTFTLGRDDFEQNFKAAGSWEAWAKRISAKGYNGKPAPYDVILCPNVVVAKATATIVRFALAVEMRVVVDVGSSFAKVTSVVEVDGKNWKGGWRLAF